MRFLPHLYFGLTVLRRFTRWGVVAVLFMVILATGAYQWYRTEAEGLIYSEYHRLPDYEVALVLGTSAYSRPGKPNPYFQTRMAAAAELYRTGRVRKLLVSGDNGHNNYNEPRDMHDALVALGVPSEHIVMDFAGFRTFDSVVRCRQVFGQQRVVVVSQRFHLERALGIANATGLEAVGYEARDPYSGGGREWLMTCREALARVRTLLDCHVLNTSPRFLGEPVDVFAENRPYLRSR